MKIIIVMAGGTVNSFQVSVQPHALDYERTIIKICHVSDRVVCVDDVRRPFPVPHTYVDLRTRAGERRTEDLRGWSQRRASRC